MIDLTDIHYVLLDLDGTLLDKHFDDEFWGKHLPQQYARRNGVTFEAACEKLYALYYKHEKTLKWTDLDFWSQEFGVNIPELKEDLWELINPHPYAETFLAAMKESGREVHLLTNAHQASVDLKFRKTGIGKYFDSVQTSNALGTTPKEFRPYWERAQELTGFDPQRSIFIDDTEAVLHAAREFGIRHVVHKGRASSRLAPVISKDFPTIIDFDVLLPTPVHSLRG